jgi:SSS family solute:Na+ symporter
MSMIPAWVFVPFYLRSGVYTMPGSSSAAYGPACRWSLTTVSVIAYVVTKISVSALPGRWCSRRCSAGISTPRRR